MPADESIGRAVAAAVSRHRVRAAILGGLVFSLGVGVVAACGSDSEVGAPVTVNDAGTDRGPIVTPPTVHVPVAIAAGGRQACAMMDDGRMFCWGSNGYGQLGNPQTTMLPDGGQDFDGRSVPFPSLASVSNVKQLSTMGARIDEGYEVRATCAVSADAQALCWGSNQFGGLGRGKADRDPHPEALPVSDLGPVEQIVTSGGASCAVTGGRAQCWGYNNHWNDAGESEYGVAKDRNVPGIVGTVRQIALGDYHGCILTTYGGVDCWGIYNDQQGIESVPFANNARVQALAAGRQTTCALMAAGGVQCFGSNGFDSLLGRGPVTGPIEQLTPGPVLLPTDKALAVQVVVSNDHACALLDDGTVWCWGKNYSGALGSGQSNGVSVKPDESATPLQVEDLPGKPTSIAAGTGFTCALLSDGKVVCWGDNSWGTLGQGTFDEVPHLTPVRVPL
ncbi:hypothetical protein LZC95_31555 [Pendulispora brunnea]|uniref:Uncharacterized protein n=1 Tax=Pendulispora brunnea TaxID=2905690 RepID=A0ABZ2JYW3_9BACT